MNFEQQKNAISLSATYIALSNQKAIRLEHYTELRKLLDELKPPRLNCSSCKHIIRSGKLYTCNSPNSDTYIGHLDKDNFGCIHHSNFEVK